MKELNLYMIVVVGLAGNVGVLLQVGIRIPSCLVLLFGFVYEFEDKNFCLALFVEPKLLPIAT
jgi:hypothetical protein